MDHKGGLMVRKALVLCAACVVLMIASGCHTVYRASEGAAKGAQEDIEDAKKADAWMQKNLW